MLKNSVYKLTFNYILIISIVCFIVSTFIYINLVKNTSELFIQEQTKIEKKFGTEDIRYLKKVQFVEDGIRNIQTKAIINLFLLNIAIISIVGILAFFFAKRTIIPIEESVRRQKEFVSNVSHELKTPLTALKSTFEIDLKSNSSDLKETIKSGIEEVDKMNSLINGFLKLSEFDSRKSDIKLETFSLNEIIAEIIKRYQFQISSKNLKIRMELNNNYINSDKFMFTEVITILIDNAIKFSNQNDEISIKSYKDGRYDFISVKDSGIGIREENLDKIFERFFKEDSSRSMKEGSGIGLSLAKEITELLGGIIIAKKNKEAGSEFVLKFSALFKN